MQYKYVGQVSESTKFQIKVSMQKILFYKK